MTWKEQLRVLRARARKVLAHPGVRRTGEILRHSDRAYQVQSDGSLRRIPNPVFETMKRKEEQRAERNTEQHS